VTGTPSATQIADLPAWARRLTETGLTADPADRAAYLAAKTALPTRITTHPHDTTDEDSR